MPFIVFFYSKYLFYMANTFLWRISTFYWFQAGFRTPMISSTFTSPFNIFHLPVESLRTIESSLLGQSCRILFPTSLQYVQNLFFFVQSRYCFTKHFFSVRFFARLLQPNQNLIFHNTRCITPKRIASWRGPSLRHRSRTTQSLRKNVAAVANPCQHCVRFDRDEI